MKSCVVAEVYPWPAAGGVELRLSNLIEGLRLLGPVEFLCLDGSDRDRSPAPEGVSVTVIPERPERSAGEWLPRWLFSNLPRRLVRRNFGEATLIEQAVASSTADVVFFAHLDSWNVAVNLCRCPAVVDFVDLEDFALRSLREAGPVVVLGMSAAGRAMAWLRWNVIGVVNSIDERRWRAVQATASSMSRFVIVPSELDRERSGCSNAVVIPNGYERAWEPSEHTEVADPAAPVFLFVGLMGYHSNTDAAQWFAADVLPRIRSDVPGARFRLVGRGCEAIEHLRGLPGVEIVGAVDTLQEELAGADVAVVPIRHGAGTRLKVVEAMANRLPTVSTTLGCEGIDVDHGVHLLIADSPDEFARQCVRLLRERDLRVSLAEAAEQRFLERYQWSAIRSRFAEVIALAANPASSDGPARSECPQSSEGAQSSDGPQSSDGEAGAQS